MGAATQPTTFSDLYTALLNALREQTGVTATETQAKRSINTALYDMHIGYSERFPWAERRATLLTHPRYTTGTITIAQGATTFSGSSTAWNTVNTFNVNNMRVGGKVVVSGSSEVYEVGAVVSDILGGFTAQFVSDSVTNGEYTYFEDEYALASDFCRPIDQQRFSEGGTEIPLVGRTEFRRMYPLVNTTGTPRVATIVDIAPTSSTTPVRKLRLYPPPQEAILMPYSYVTTNLAITSAGAAQAQLVNDTDEPIVPLRYRHAIVLHALYNWYRDKRDDARAAEAKGEYTDILLRIASDFEIGQSRPRITPLVAPYKRRARNPWRSGGSRRYQTGNEFDTLKV